MYKIMSNRWETHFRNYTKLYYTVTYVTYVTYVPIITLF